MGTLKVGMCEGRRGPGIVYKGPGSCSSSAAGRISGIQCQTRVSFLLCTSTGSAGASRLSWLRSKEEALEARESRAFRSAQFIVSDVVLVLCVCPMH